MQLAAETPSWPACLSSKHSRHARRTAEGAGHADQLQARGVEAGPACLSWCLERRLELGDGCTGRGGSKKSSMSPWSRKGAQEALQKSRVCRPLPRRTGSCCPAATTWRPAHAEQAAFEHDSVAKRACHPAEAGRERQEVQCRGAGCTALGGQDGVQGTEGQGSEASAGKGRPGRPPWEVQRTSRAGCPSPRCDQGRGRGVQYRGKSRGCGAGRLLSHLGLC